MPPINIEELSRRVRSGDVQFLSPESFVLAHKQLDEMEEQVRTRIQNMATAWNKSDKSDKQDDPAARHTEFSSLVAERIRAAVKKGDLPVITDITTVKDKPLTGFILKAKELHIALIRPTYWREVICKNYDPESIISYLRKETGVRIEVRRKIGKYGFLRFIRVEVKL